MMRFFALIAFLAVITGCNSLVVKTDVNIDPGSVLNESYRIHRDKKDVDPYPYVENRKPLSEVSKQGPVWVVGGQFHTSPNCSIAYKQYGGSFANYERALADGAKPCRYCIDINK